MIALDSSFLIAFKIKNDIHHDKANALMKQIASGHFGKPFITSYIFDETVTGIFVRSKNLRLAVEYGNELLSSLEVFDINEDTFQESWKIFSAQKESELSFTDSTTIAVVNGQGERQIATFDRDFALQGISAVGLE